MEDTRYGDEPCELDHERKTCTGSNVSSIWSTTAEREHGEQRVTAIAAKRVDLRGCPTGRLALARPTGS